MKYVIALSRKYLVCLISKSNASISLIDFTSSESNELIFVNKMFVTDSQISNPNSDSKHKAPFGHSSSTTQHDTPRISNKNNFNISKYLKNYFLKKMNFGRPECINIYRNLIELLDNRSIINPRFYIRELMQTEGCEDYHNLEDLRESVVNKMGKIPMERIIGNTPYESQDIDKYHIEKEEDEEKAFYTLMHYHNWHKKTILNCLPWSYWFYYKIPGITTLLSLSGSHKWVIKKDKL